jgi:hypothetical protein
MKITVINVFGVIIVRLTMIVKLMSIAAIIDANIDV